MTQETPIYCACGCGREVHPRPHNVKRNKTGNFFYSRECQKAFNRDTHAGKGQKQMHGYRRPVEARV